MSTNDSVPGDAPRPQSLDEWRTRLQAFPTTVETAINEAATLGAFPFDRHDHLRNDVERAEALRHLGHLISEMRLVRDIAAELGRDLAASRRALLRTASSEAESWLRRQLNDLGGAS